nr:nucleolar protein dao-5 [Drosophila suzukii]
MRAGKKQAAESVKTRPCIVYVRNLHEEEAPTRGAAPAGKLRKRDQQREAQQELRETRTSRRSVVPVQQDKPTPRTRHAVKPAASPSPSPPSRPKISRDQAAAREQQSSSSSSANLAKRRSTLLLGGSHPHGGTHHKLGLLKAQAAAPRRSQAAQAETPKMYKQPAATKHVPESPPPTIAASRSRRSIKPNPKYASDDMVTPKYMATLGDGGGSQSIAGRQGRQSKQLFTNDDDISDLLDLDEDDDDELADAAFNPQLHKSDEDDDDDEDEDMSEAEYEQELRRKLPPVKRGRGRPPKANNANAASTHSAGNVTSSGANPKISINSTGGRTAPSGLQQLRRTMAVNMARNNASLTEGSGSGSAAAKRKLDTSDGDSLPVARKRMVISSSTQQRSVPVVNGATSKTSAPTRPKLGHQAGGVPARMLPQRRGSNYKINSSSSNNSNALVTSTPATRTVGAGASNSDAKNESETDDVPTFTIVNIDDIINQDDVLITRSHNAIAAAAAGGNASKKLAVGRPRTRNIPSSNSGVSEKKSITVSSEKSTPAAVNNNTAAGHQAKRIKILASNSSVNTKLGPLHIQSQSHNQIQQPKPRPRILNAEMGKKTQSMKPLMSMGKELCPTDVDTEEDDPDPDLDFDDDDIPASIVSRKNPKQVVTAPVASAGGGGGPTSAASKWNANRRNVLSTTASTVNARADRKLSKLLGEVDEPQVFKKPSLSPQRRSKENQHEQRDKEEAGQQKEPTPAGGGPEDTGSPKYFPPETTTFCEEDGRVVKKITCYETWHVISTPKESPTKTTRQQRTCLELALVKLANVAARIKVPSGKWTSKVTLYKVSPSLMTRQTMTIFTGDLTAYNIPEDDRHKYQPSCVLFRRSVMDRNKCRVPYDRAIIFKNKCFYANIDGKHVNLMGAPETVATVKDVEILLDIVDRLSLSSALVEMVNTK